MSASIKDIARLVGISRQAAASVLNNSPVCHVSAAKREQILRIARELNYHPNEAAKVLKGKHSRTVGVLIDSYANDVVIKILAGLEENLAHAGYRVQVGLTHENKQRFLDYLADFRRIRVAGVIALAHTYAEPNFNLYTEMAGYPNLVLFGRPSLPDKHFPRVELDWVAAYQSLTARLAATGARRIAIQISWPGYSCEILEGYRLGLKQAGIPFRQELLMDIRELQLHPISVYAQRLLDSKVDALLSNDDLAVRLLSELQLKGIRVPEHIQIIGRYNLNFGTYIHPQLTTLDCCTVEVAQALTKKLLALIASKEVPECDSIIPTLVQRHSSKIL